MTSVLSLTAMGSGGVTNTSSALFLAVGNSFSAISLTELTKLAPMNVGAMWTTAVSQSIRVQSFETIAFSSLQYDTGSWTDSNSNGLFVVRNDKWEIVEVGFNLTVGVTINDPLFRVTKITGNNSYTTIQRGVLFGDTTNNLASDTIVGLLPVDSGDVLAAQVFNSDAATRDIVTDYNDAFWIRGVQARG